MRKIREGDYSDFEDALMKSTKDGKVHYFCFNTTPECFVFLKFLFSSCTKIKMFNNDISIFSANKQSQLKDEIGNNSDRVYSNFVNSIRNYFSKNNKLELLVENIDDDFQNSLSTELSKTFIDNYNNGHIVIQRRNTDIEAINDLNHFIISPDKNIICFEQKDQDLQMCIINNSGICNKANFVFDLFMRQSISEEMISLDND